MPASPIVWQKVEAALTEAATGFAHRRLPLRIPDQHGWEPRSPIAAAAVWYGGSHPDPEGDDDADVGAT